MTATQPPLLTLIHSRRPGDVIDLPARARDLDRARDRATEQALSPDVVADMREAAAKALATLAAHPGTPMVAVLLDAMRHAYVAGRMDQAADDALVRAQADRLAEGALAQVTQLVQRGEAS